MRRGNLIDRFRHQANLLLSLRPVALLYGFANGR